MIIALIVGIGIGIAIGLGISWELSPYPYGSAEPDDLKIEYQDDYIVHVSLAYAVNGNLSKARRRLAALHSANTASRVAELGEQYAAVGDDLAATRALAKLAYALGTHTVALAPFIDTPTPTATPTNTPTATPRPTYTPLPISTPTEAATPYPTATPPVQYKLVKRAHTACATELTSDLIKIWVMDAERRGLSGVKLKVAWADGEEYLFTGLKPEISAGYADFAMGTKSYRVAVADGVSEVAVDIAKRATGEKCGDKKKDETYRHLWTLVFQWVD